MIKGHMTIELADGKTGKVVEKHEDDNLVTNGVKHYFQSMGFFNPTALNGASSDFVVDNPNDFLIPLFGGLLLFDTAQTENVEHLNPEPGSIMTGNGINNYTSNDSVTEFGSYNSEESGWQEDGSLKQVWDFTTTQANGTIACACLCPYSYGVLGEGNSTSKAIKTSSSGMSSYTFWEYSGYRFNKTIAPPPNNLFGGSNMIATILKVDTVNNYAIVLGWEYRQRPVQFKAVKVAFPYSKIDIRNGQANYRILSEIQNVTLPSVANSGYMYTYRNILGMASDGGLYVLLQSASYDSSYFNSTYPAYILKIKAGANDVVTAEHILTLTPSLIGQATGSCYFTSPHACVSVNDNLFLAVGSSSNTIDKSKWYKINLLTGVVEAMTDNSISTTSSFGGRDCMYPIPESNSILAGGSNFLKIDLTAKTVTSLNKIQSSFAGGSLFADAHNAGMVYPMVIETNSAMNFTIYRTMHFLSTINNLESPVVKTADKTMKVTYVLRFDAE